MVLIGIKELHSFTMSLVCVEACIVLCQHGLCMCIDDDVRKVYDVQAIALVRFSVARLLRIR